MFCITWRLGKIKAPHVYVVTLSAHSASPWGVYAPFKMHRITWLQVPPALDAHDSALQLGWMVHSLACRQSMRLWKVAFSFVLFLTILAWEDALTGRL